MNAFEKELTNINQGVSEDEDNAGQSTILYVIHF